MTVSHGEVTVTGTVSFDPESSTVTFSPGAPLLPDTTYEVAVSATDLVGNATAAPLTFSFATVTGSPVVALWDDTAVPAIPASSDVKAVEVGVKFTASVEGAVTGLRFYKGAGNGGTHIGSLWDATGNLLARVTFTGESSTGWQEALFDEPVELTPGQVYVASYHAPNGRYPTTSGYFALPHVNGVLTAPASGASGGNGVYRYGTAPAFPSLTSGQTNYWVTPVFAEAPDAAGPVLTATTPVADSTSAPIDTVITATFDEAVEPASVTLAVVGGAGPVAGSTSYDPGSRTVTFTPGAALQVDTSYTVQVTAVDLAGNASGQLGFTFTTVTGATVVALWDDTAVPTVAASTDAAAVEVGVKFRAGVAGEVTGIRFYKGPGNTGTHVASLWSASGTLLARATFTGESAGGWQEVQFPTPVSIVSGQIYVASYYAPNGRYSADSQYFAQARVNGVLTAPSSSSSGGNGVYRYGTGPVFPTSAFKATNYWVTPVFAEAD
jgi:methionine-rich copper-binding protein CopC